ncbi:MAG TPA: hypothetical protein VEF53_11725, partial [Patescibacteria group bacterium]|nr:hypothetical protein [Patescibacteria group bacterium]
MMNKHVYRVLLILCVVLVMGVFCKYFFPTFATSFSPPLGWGILEALQAALSPFVKVYSNGVNRLFTQTFRSPASY